MNRKGSALLIIVLVVMLAIIGIAAWLYFASTSHSQINIRNSSQSTSTENLIGTEILQSQNCGTEDFHNYFIEQQQLPADQSAFTCIEQALLSCSAAHLTLTSDPLQDHSTTTIMYGVMHDASDSCFVAQYSVPIPQPREICTFPKSFLKNMLVSRAVPGASLFVSVRLSFFLGKIADSSEQPLSCEEITD